VSILLGPCETKKQLRLNQQSWPCIPCVKSPERSVDTIDCRSTPYRSPPFCLSAARGTGVDCRFLSESSGHERIVDRCEYGSAATGRRTRPNGNALDFFFTVPKLKHDRTVLRFQQKFVDKSLSYSLRYGHVLLNTYADRISARQKRKARRFPPPTRPSTSSAAETPIRLATRLGMN